MGLYMLGLDTEENISYTCQCSTRWLAWLIWEQVYTLATRRFLYETYDSRHQKVNIGQI